MIFMVPNPSRFAARCYQCGARTRLDNLLGDRDRKLGDGESPARSDRRNTTRPNWSERQLNLWSVNEPVNTEPHRRCADAECCPPERVCPVELLALHRLLGAARSLSVNV